MKRRLYELALCGLLAALVCWSQSLGAVARNLDYATLESLALSELKENQTPGAAPAIIQDGRVVYAKGFGVANVETHQPVTPDMLFRLGSTTKMFTAAALVTLAAQGKLKLDAAIGSYTKGLHTKLAALTPHQLMSASAGLRDFASPVTLQEGSSLAANVRGWKQDVFFTEPGNIYSYSSPGYWLAGFVVEEVGGKPYAEAMQELLFTPLGMSHSTFRPLVAATYPLALGHSVEKGKAAIVRPVFNNAAMWPGGSLYSNVHDLARFVIALTSGGKLEDREKLSPLAAYKLPSPHISLPGESAAFYGYGLLTFPYRGVQLVTHGGATRGYGSTIQIVPAHRLLQSDRRLGG